MISKARRRRDVLADAAEQSEAQDVMVVKGLPANAA
jgi:hypothetical protein